jgi:hypothetical protein
LPRRRAWSAGETGEKADKKAAVSGKKAVQKPGMPGKRAGRQGTAVEGGRMPGTPNRPAGKTVEMPGKKAGKTGRRKTLTQAPDVVGHGSRRLNYLAVVINS